jgi:hypothetical protein
LKRSQCRRLKSHIGLETAGNLTYYSLKGQLSNEQIGRALILADFAQCNSSSCNENMQTSKFHINFLVGRNLRRNRCAFLTPGLKKKKRKK